jgi:hypothetical protein
MYLVRISPVALRVVECNIGNDNRAKLRIRLFAVKARIAEHFLRFEEPVFQAGP